MEERTDLKYCSDIAPDNTSEMTENLKTVSSPLLKMGAETAEANINAGLASANQIVNFFATGDKHSK